MTSYVFDPTTVIAEEKPNYQPLPVGPYRVMVLDSDIKTTKRGDGKYVAVAFQVLEPEKYKGRRLFSNFNIENPSEKAQQIGRSQFKGFLEAIGIKKPVNIGDPNLLANKVLWVTVGVEPGQASGEMRNFVKSYLIKPETMQAVKSESTFDSSDIPF